MIANTGCKPVPQRVVRRGYIPLGEQVGPYLNLSAFSGKNRQFAEQSER